MSCSTDLFKRAQRVIPGGVNSPVRAFRAVQSEPVYVQSGSGACVRTVDGQMLVDFCGSWGPLILGHAHPEVVERIINAVKKGTSFGINTEAEVELAETLCRLIPEMEQVRLVNSGTEAVMTAIRLARGTTGRHRLLKFDGCYHGHSDSMLVAAGSGLLTGGQSASAGVTPATAQEVVVAPFNDLESVDRIVDHFGSELAAIIVEPVAANMGLVLPTEGFLKGLRTAADRCGALLIFDEVITGFRFGLSSYGHLHGIRADLTTLGKIIGGGMPMGAVGGSSGIMSRLAPSGPVYQAGTLSGNPAAVAAGLATLQILQRDIPYPRLEKLAATLATGLEEAGRQSGVNLCCVQKASLFTAFFRKGTTAPHRLEEVKQSNTKSFATFFNGMLEQGFYLPPSQFETAFVNAAHSETQIEAFIHSAVKVLKSVSTR